MVLAVALHGGVDDVLEQDVRLAVDDPVPLLDGGPTDGLREVALAGARRPEEESVLAPVDEAASREVVDQAAIHLLVEVEIEAVEGAFDVAKFGLFCATFEQAACPPGKLVGYQHGDEVDGRHALGLRLLEARLDHGGHATEAQLLEGAVEFNKVHRRSPGSVG